MSENRYNKPMKHHHVAILGGGWLGLPLAQTLAASGMQVKVATRSASRQSTIQQQLPGEAVYRVDIAARQPITAFLQSDCLIINITHKVIADFQWLLGQIRQSPVRHVLFVSSTSVYPSLNRSVAEDEGAENPDSPLWQIEQLFRQQPDLATTIVRFGGLIDSRRHPGRFFREGKTLRQPDARVNLIHLDDCIGVITTVLEKQAWGEVFNAVADSHPPKKMFYQEMAARAGLPSPASATPATASFKIISNHKIKTQLGYRLQHPDLLQIDFGRGLSDNAGVWKV